MGVRCRVRSQEWKLGGQFGAAVTSRQEAWCWLRSLWEVLGWRLILDPRANSPLFRQECGMRGEHGKQSKS